MDVLRAIWQQARSAGLLTQVTELWPQAVEIVETDMELTDVLEFLPLATSLELNQIERYNLVIGVHAESFTTPDDGRSTLLPNWPLLHELAQNFVTPPTGNRLERSTITIDVVDSTGWGINFDLLAADRLAWEGFAVNPLGKTTGSFRDLTVIYDYTGDTKGGALNRVMETIRVPATQIIFEPDPNRTVDYRVEVGKDYYGCSYGSSADDLLEEGPPVENTDNPTPEATTVG